MRLDRLIAKHAQLGKRDVRPLLAAARVKVDDQVEKNGQTDIGEFTKVSLDNEILQNKKAIYLMLNKPAGYVSATKDPEHSTVMELIDPEDHPESLHIAGRLDRASTGLLFLTNDGTWSRLLTNPAKENTQGIPKTYQVTTERPITNHTVELFSKGIYFAYEDLTTQPAELEIISAHQCLLTIYEGKYHQIKRMFHASENRVTSLHRTRIGNITLDSDLKSGKYRALSGDEIKLSMIR